MTKKILFLLTFLLVTTGGSKLWAETDDIDLNPFSSGEVSAKAFTRTGSLFSVSVTGCKYLDSNTFQLGDGTQFVITPSNSNVKVLSIGFTNKGTGYSNNATCSINGASVGKVFINKKGGANSPETCTWNNDTDETTFTIVFGNSGGDEPYAKITSITITYQVMYRGSMPYTWNFHYGGGSNYWPYTTGEMLTSTTTYWKAGAVGKQSGYVTNTARNNEALVDGSGNVISETKGLKFTAAAGNIGTALQYELALQGSASVTIPAKAGQKIAVHAWWPAETMTLEHATVDNTSNETTFTPSPADAYTYIFTATADNVTLHVNNNMVFIYSIAVTKGDIGNFRLEKNQGYTYQGHDKTDTYIWPYGAETTKNFNFKVSNGPSSSEIGLLYDATENPGGIAVNSTNFTLSSDNADVISVSGFSQPADGSKLRRIKWNDVTFGKPGEATVTFTFNGNDQFDSKTFTQKFTITKLEQVLTFDDESMSVDYEADGKSTPQTVTKVVNQKYADGYRTGVTSTYVGTDVTYSSSNTNVAAVNATTGEITMKNAGVTTITATAPSGELYEEATASYELTVNGTQTPTLAWKASNNFTNSGGDYKAADLPYGNSQSYKAEINTTDGSVVSESEIRYGLVEGYEGYLTIDASSGKIEPTRKFADESLTEKEVYVYAYIPGSGTRNPAPRITYKVKIVKGTFSGNLFKQNYLTVNAGCTIAPQNNVQSMRWDDIDAITVVNKTGRTDIAVSGPGTEMVSDYKADTSNKTLYFDTKTKDGVEIVDWFYPVFHGKAVGNVTFTVTLKSKLYGDHSGDFTLHVIAANEHTGFAWAKGTKTKYTIYEGDYMLLPEVTGSTNGNFSYSVGAANQSTHHKYVYTRRWDGTQYVTTYNNKNFHKGEGFPNFDLTKDDAGTIPVTSVDPNGDNVALLFWNTGTGTENDRLLIYGNQAGTVYLKAFDPQITTRALSTIEIEVKSKTDINADFESLKSSMTFPYTWDFTTDYDWSAEIETGTGNWIQDGSTYDLGMSSNINYDYADEDNDGIVWGNDNDDPTTDSNELTDKLLVGTNDNVLRGFAGMKIRLGNSGKGSWYSKRDGIHILPYTNSNTPRLRVTTGTHTLILPTPTGANCPATFKVFVKAKALEAGEGTLWVRNADLDRNAPGQNKYHNFKSASEGDVIIYSVDANRDTPLELDLDKVDVYWIAYSTEVKNVVCPRDANSNLNYAAASYSYPEDLDLSKSAEVNSGVTAYYASKYGYNAAAVATGTEGYAVVMTEINTPVPANTGLILKKNTTEASTSCYMIANGKNVASYTEPESLTTNYLKATPAGGGQVSSNETINSKTYTNFTMAYAYKMYRDPMDAGSAYTGYLFDRDWSFYRIMGDVYFSPQKSYLQIPGNLYVDRDGNIVQGASRRAADDNRPSTKPMLDIIFEDEPLGDPNVTGISTVSDRLIDNDAWYTLQGIRVDAPAKGGIYIHNGRKVVIK